MIEDIRTYVEFLVLARNRSTPSRTVNEYVQKLFKSLPYYAPFCHRADFVFFYVVFDFHGMLPPTPEATMVYPKWLKSYRQLVAEGLGTVVGANPVWQGFMELMQRFPKLLASAQQNICLPNVTKSIVNNIATSSIHEECAKLWCTMRYNPKYWILQESLNELLKEIGCAECQYDVPFFSQCISAETPIVRVPVEPIQGKSKRCSPNSFLRLTIGTATVPEQNKHLEIDFIPGCNGVGYECFHLPSFLARHPVHNKNKRSGENLPQPDTKR